MEVSASHQGVRWWRGLDLNQRPLGYEPGQRHLATSRLVPKRPSEQDFLPLLLLIDPTQYRLMSNGTLEDPLEARLAPGSALRSHLLS